MKKMTAEEIIRYIGTAEKVTPVKAYVQENIPADKVPTSVQRFAAPEFTLLIGDYRDVALSWRIGRKRRSTLR